ncbi:MAG: hypothetical protein IKE43_00995 [Coriobacteriales bacterium]|nr:hypothetical protein [Coriobacteriales bacterium]
MKKRNPAKLTASAIVAGCLAVSSAGLSGCTPGSIPEVIESVINNVTSVIGHNPTLYGPPPDDIVLPYEPPVNINTVVYGPPEDFYDPADNDPECLYGPPEMLGYEPINNIEEDVYGPPSLFGYQPDDNLPVGVYGPPEDYVLIPATPTDDSQNTGTQSEASGTAEFDPSENELLDVYGPPSGE